MVCCSKWRDRYGPGQRPAHAPIPRGEGAGLSAPAAAAKQEQLAQHQEHPTRASQRGAGAAEPPRARGRRRRLDCIFPTDPPQIFPTDPPQARRRSDEGPPDEGSQTSKEAPVKWDGEVRKLFAEARSERDNRARAEYSVALV